MKYRLVISSICFCLINSFGLTQAQESINFFPRVPVPPRLDENQQDDIKIKFSEVDQLDPLTIPVGEDQKSLTGPKYITISSITFEGNQVIPDEEIRQLVTPYEGRTIPRSQLIEIVERIKSLYTQKGYEGSGGIITRESSFVNGQLEVKIQIVEAKISNIRITGAGRLKRYIKQQTKSLEGDLLNTNKINNKLRFLLNDNRIENLSLSTLSQPQVDQKELYLNVSTNNPILLTALFNNRRSPSSGSFGRGLSAKHTNLAGIGDQLSIEYRNTEGSNIVGLNYDIPINGSGGEIQFGYLNGNTKVIDRQVREFNIRSKTQIFSVGFSQPILRQSSNNMTQEVVLGIGAARTENEDSILGFAFPLIEGANEKGRIRSTRMDFSQSYSKRMRRNILLLDSKFSFGLGIGSTNDDSFGKGEFFKWTGSGLFAQRISDRFLYISSLNVQFADQDLIGNEQFILGGRGFLLNQLARTNGLNLTQEIRYNAYNKNDFSVDLSTFLDFGSAWNNQRQFLEKRVSLAAVGIGLSCQFSDQIRAKFEYAVPLFGPENKGKSLQANGLLLSLEFSF